MKTAARAADDKKADNVLILDMRGVLPITDYFLICSGETTRQVKAIAEAIEERLVAAGVKPYMREGRAEAAWVILDYIDFVVHVFRTKEREYYQIERLWKDAPEVVWR